MTTLTGRAVTVTRGARRVLDAADVTVGPHTRAGLVGPNGAGKSTLLRVLAGLERPESGAVTRSPAHAAVGLLPQEPDQRPGESLLSFLRRRTGVAAAEHDLESAAGGLGGAPAADDRYERALERFLSLGGPDLDARAAEVCTDLGLSADLLGVGTAELSGGQWARASLAGIVLARFDVFLLDEPTNDLDLDGLARLEEFVRGLRVGLVVVSHDREFLAATVTSVIDIDATTARVSTYAGGWTAYLEERATVRRQARARYEDYADQRSALTDRTQAARERSVRGALRARRRSQDNDRAARGARIEAATAGAAKVRALETRLDRLDAQGVEEPRREWQLRLEILAAPRSGRQVASLRAAMVRRGDWRLGPVDLDVTWADRIAVTGANGAGKTTLLAALLGRVPLAGGTATLGPGVVIGELDQTRRRFATDDPLVDVVGGCTALPPEEVRTLLAKFGIRGADATRPARSLSPGERTRAGLALLMAAGVNCLVLDEPTNHLDLAAIEQLEQALAGYQGTLLLVSHDRRLLETVALTRTVHVEAGAVRERAVARPADREHAGRPAR